MSKIFSTNNYTLLLFSEMPFKWQENDEWVDFEIIQNLRELSRKLNLIKKAKGYKIDKNYKLGKL